LHEIFGVGGVVGEPECGSVKLAELGNHVPLKTDALLG